MAAISMAAPGAKGYNGEEIGPCVNEACGHTDCARTRKDAATACSYCGKPIGYDVKFYNLGENWDDKMKLVHFLCHLQAIEEKRA